MLWRGLQNFPRWRHFRDLVRYELWQENVAVIAVNHTRHKPSGVGFKR